MASVIHPSPALSTGGPSRSDMRLFQQQVQVPEKMHHCLCTDFQQFWHESRRACLSAQVVLWQLIQAWAFH